MQKFDKAASFWNGISKNQERQHTETDQVDLEHVFDRDSSLIRKIQIPGILDDCIEILRALRQEIESDGFNKECDTAVLEKIYGSDTDSRKTLLESYSVWTETAEGSEEERQREGYATPEQCKKEVLSEIDAEIHRLRTYGRKRTSMESERMKLEVLRHRVPGPTRLERLLRYETSLERVFDRTLNQLERMQRLRRGQPVAPRIDVSVSS